MRLRKIGHDDQGLFLQRLQHERPDIADCLHSVSKVLQTVDQLAARQQILIENERQRCCHGSILEQPALNCKNFRRGFARVTLRLPCPRHAWPRVQRGANLKSDLLTSK